MELMGAAPPTSSADRKLFGNNFDAGGWKILCPVGRCFSSLSCHASQRFDPGSLQAPIYRWFAIPCDRGITNRCEFCKFLCLYVLHRRGPRSSWITTFGTEAADACLVVSGALCLSCNFSAQAPLVQHQAGIMCLRPPMLLHLLIRVPRRRSRKSGLLCGVGCVVVRCLHLPK